jgi:GTP-binding protein
MAGVDGRQPWDDYIDLRGEMSQYRVELLDFPGIVVANKMDLPAAAENLKEFKARTGASTVALSALTGVGVSDLKKEIQRAFRKGRPA